MFIKVLAKLGSYLGEPEPLTVAGSLAGVAKSG